MDHLRDDKRFRALLGRLCDTLGKPLTNELHESWWKALRHIELADFERRVDDFLANATPETRFPRPSQLRSQEQTPRAQVIDGNPLRDYWRSAIVTWVGRDLGYDYHQLEQAIIGNSTLAYSLRELLDHMCDEQAKYGRTHSLEVLCRQQCASIASKFKFAQGASHD